MTGETPPAAKGVTEALRHISRLAKDRTEDARHRIDAIVEIADGALASLPAPGEGEAAKVIARTMCVMQGENPDEQWVAPDDTTAARWEHRLPWARMALEAARPYLSTPSSGGLAVKADDSLVQCGWAYQDKRWDADRWHVCGFENKPREHEGRLVRPIYVALSSLDRTTLPAAEGEKA